MKKYLSGAIALSLLAFGATLAADALADEAEAEACVRQKVWDGYSDGWSIRTLTSATLATGSTQNYLVTLYKGNEYQIQTCSGKEAKNMDVLLYDLNGKIMARDDAEGPDPMLTYKPEATATYYIVAYARELNPGNDKVPVAVALTYR